MLAEPVIRDFIACDQDCGGESGWLACSPTDRVFFRLVRTGNAPPTVDLVVDTQAGAGRMVKNVIKCLVPSGALLWRKTHHLGGALPGYRPPDDVQLVVAERLDDDLLVLVA